MKPVALAYIALVGLFFLPLACSYPGIPNGTEDGEQPDTAYAWQRVLEQSLDSLKRGQGTTCDTLWRADLGKSILDCKDPRPPAPKAL